MEITKLNFERKKIAGYVGMVIHILVRYTQTE